MRTRLKKEARKYQAGSVITEAALTSVLFFGLVIGVFEFGRLGYTYATAVEATRIGARLAVVCGTSPAAVTVIKAKMIALVPQLSANDISITYPSATDPVTVKINAGVNIQLSIPLALVNVPMPAFATSLTPEFMATSTPASAVPPNIPNPAC
jgi:Flp pilus assembly protein TadG